MIESLYQIDFITTSGTLRLLDVGDWIEADIAPKVSQSAAQYAAIGAAWGETVASGGAMVTVDFSVVKNHGSHAALRDYCMSHAAAFPGGKTGTLRLAISGGDTWDIADATLVSCSPMALLPSGEFETLTAYSATGGQMRPASAIPLYAGIPYEYILQNWEDIATNWENL
jgi:hypothetical protein